MTQQETLAKQLPPRLAEIFTARAKGETFKAIGEKHNITNERAQQLFKEACKRLAGV